ncbi:MAG TPA: hypothetical protein VFV98_17370 [Vicinamibacterales bacterium]|nr:hypothetical protein [Vicinamibacterales bacterium]
MTMRRVSAVVGFAVAGVLATSPALAQGGYTQAIGGMTSAAQQRAFAGALAGATFGSIDINVEGGYMQDVLPKGLLDELNEFQEGLPAQAKLILPATYFMGNVRYITPQGSIHVFAGAGFGIAHVKPKFEVTVSGVDLGNAISDVEAQNKPLVSFGGGVRFDIGTHSLLDVGYRYTTIFTDYDAPLLGETDIKASVHTFYAAFGVRF